MNEWEVVARTLAALVAGGAIGLERSYHGRAAGLRTYALVCFGSALLVAVAQFDVGAGAHGRGEVTRVIQGIVTGIGFLGAGVIVKGLRAVSDFEFEMQMALMNRKLNPEVETVFMMPTQPYTYVSSRLVKEVVALGGSVHGLVPESVEKRLREKKLARETLRA